MGAPKVGADETLASHVVNQEDWERVGTFTDQISLQIEGGCGSRTVYIGGR